jgi:hypothetical protein
MTSGFYAVNYCRSRALYLNQINEARHRCNVNNLSELVQWLDENDMVIEETEIHPDPSRKIVRNTWH